MKHFRVNVRNGHIVFGQEKFPNVESFIEHFDNHPLIGDDTGKFNTVYTHIIEVQASAVY